MNEEEFKDYIARLTLAQEKHPLLFNVILFLLIAAGFAYLFLIIAVELILIFIMSVGAVFSSPLALVIAVLIGIVFIQTVRSVYRMIAFKVEPPDGILLNSQDSTELYKEIDCLRKEMNCERVHKIYIVNETRAYITQIPKFGIFGGYRNYLVLGMPLMFLLDRNQMKAVIAHELGHISRKHGHFSIWAVRMESVWTDTIKRMVWSTMLGEAFFMKFYRWFIMHLNARTFVIRRFFEKEADQDASRLAGNQVLADSLALLSIFDM